jgi:hypothetical protein
MSDRPSNATHAGDVAATNATNATEAIDAIDAIPDLSTRAFLPYPVPARELTAHAEQGTLL